MVQRKEKLVLNPRVGTVVDIRLLWSGSILKAWLRLGWRVHHQEARPR